MNLLNIIGSLLGIGKGYLSNRAKQKQLEANQRHEIIIAETKAIVNRIEGNSQSDNEIDLITARNKKYTLKDDLVTYLFLIPVFVASIVPFAVAFESGEWTELNTYVKESYLSLNDLPDWYKYVVFAIVIDVLGFRSFARKLVNNWYNKKQ